MALAAAAHIILVLGGQVPLGKVMPVALARVGPALAEAAVALVLLVLHRAGGHQPAVMAALVSQALLQAHQSHALAAAVVVVIFLSALVEQVAGVMAALTPPVLLG